LKSARARHIRREADRAAPEPGGEREEAQSGGQGVHREHPDHDGVEHEDGKGGCQRDRTGDQGEEPGPAPLGKGAAAVIGGAAPARTVTQLAREVGGDDAPDVFGPRQNDGDALGAAAELRRGGFGRGGTADGEDPGIADLTPRDRLHPQAGIGVEPVEQAGVGWAADEVDDGKIGLRSQCRDEIVAADRRVGEENAAERGVELPLLLEGAIEGGLIDAAGRHERVPEPSRGRRSRDQGPFGHHHGLERSGQRHTDYPHTGTG
jgi:hypothetical protein